MMHSNRNLSLSLGVALIVGFLIVAYRPLALAQGRISDQDVQSLMSNLKEDAKSFRSSFKRAIEKSSIRKTSRAKDARDLVARFQRQTETMLNQFKKTKKGDADLANVLGSAREINGLVYGLNLASAAASWEKIQAELRQLGNAFGMAYSPTAVAPPPAAGGPSCLVSVGAEQSKRLVDDCLQVSPATHPPCNAQNSCLLIIDEIKRGCSMLGRNAPALCDEYRPKN